MFNDELPPHFRRRVKSSSAVDLPARRGVFSRRHYGSVELLVSCDSEGCYSGRFRVEDGSRDELSAASTGTDVHLENPENQTRWYFKYFLGKVHQNYVGLDVEKNVYFLSVVLTDANNHNVPQYRGILWRKQGTQKISVLYNPTKPMSVKGILKRFDIRIDKTPKEIFTAEIQKELLLLEEQEGSVNFKFGVLYAKEGQTTDDDMFSNEIGSPNFDKFVRLLGDYSRLKGWDRFNGGLDTKSDTTGLETVYTTFEGHEIMYHVSTLLPYSSDNRQQVERKRHIGNDIAAIVFQEVANPDDEPTFKPSMIRSHFTHIFALVTYNTIKDTYRLWVFSEESVPLFGPPLPCPAEFENHKEFRDFLLVKRKYCNMLNKRSFSDVIPEPHWGWRSKKEEARQAEFVRVGQSLKLRTIVKGDAPTSTATTSLLKREPWEPQLMAKDFPYEIICGDSWGEKLVVVTEEGVFILEDSVQPRLIIDKSVSVKQLSVVEAHGLLLFRADKGKESRVYVFRLSMLEGEKNQHVLLGRAEIKEHKLERTKGCHLYALSRPGGIHLRMAVAVCKKILLMTWKHSIAWTTWCTTADTDTIDGFQFVRELSANDVPCLLTLVDGGSKGDNEFCVGYRQQFDLINEKNGDTFRVHMVESTKVDLVSAVDMYEDDEPELLLTYNLLVKRNISYVADVFLVLFSGNASNSLLQIYRITLASLVGQVCDRALPSPSKPQPPSFISPLVNDCSLLKPSNSISYKAGHHHNHMPPNKEISLRLPSFTNSNGNTEIALVSPRDRSPMFSDETVESKRRLFGGIRSPKSCKKTVSTTSDSDSDTKLGSKAASTCSSDSQVFMSSDFDSGIHMASPTYKTSSKTNSNVYDFDAKPDIQNKSNLRKCGFTQSEAECRAELLGKSTSKAPDNHSEKRDILKSLPERPVKLSNIKPYTLSSSLDDEDIDLK
ncbi:GTPase-activating Rap/Ran-GAP domain-like protein 3 [Anneissia japonica]|uniref:GTPase-activating Rap/Ran-GAP domain-like protein 3 n=1 Tax=Anneissia japonica TaxID=1529436 RepID=UPI001425B288|nr:GTPase-activating Rap/Ran-GAP domain-like protein 3 [Anneissia japonica]